MRKKYLVQFEEVNGFLEGATVRGSDVAGSQDGLDYLVRIGAIVPFTSPPVNPSPDPSPERRGETAPAVVGADAADDSAPSQPPPDSGEEPLSEPGAPAADPEDGESHGS